MRDWERHAGEGRSLGDFWMGLYRRRWVFVLTVATALGVAYLVSANLPQVYETRAVFFVPADPAAVTFYSADAVKTVIPAPKVPIPRESAQAIHIGILKSDTVRERVHQMIPAKSVHDLRRDVDFRVTDEFTLEVYARDRSPEVAAQVANAYLQAFEEQLQAMAAQAVGPSVITAIETQIVETKARLAEAREALQAFEQENQTAKFEEYVSRVAREHDETERLIDEARVSLNEVNKKLMSLEVQLAREAAIHTPQELTTTSPLVEVLRKDLAELEAQLAGARTRLKEQHPEFRMLTAQITHKQQQLNEEIERIIKAQTKPTNPVYENLRQSLITTLVEKRGLEARIEGHKRLLRELESRTKTHPQLRQEHEMLTREIAREETALDNLKNQLAEARAQQQSQPRISMVVDWAHAPDTPSFPITWLNMLVAGILGLIGAFYYCTVLDYASRVRAQRRRDPYRAAVKALLDAPGVPRLPGPTPAAARGHGQPVPEASESQPSRSA